MDLLAAKTPLPGPVMAGFFVLVGLALVTIVILRSRRR